MWLWDKGKPLAMHYELSKTAIKRSTPRWDAVDVRLLWDSDEVMQLNISVEACTAVHTWPGTTALENSLFSWTSSLGVVSNLSAMLFNVSRDSTWTTKQERGHKNHTPAPVQDISIKLYREDLMMWHRWWEMVREKMKTVQSCAFIIVKGFNVAWFVHRRFWDVMQIEAVSCWPGIDSHGRQCCRLNMNWHECQQPHVATSTVFHFQTRMTLLCAESLGLQLWIKMIVLIVD